MQQSLHFFSINSVIAGEELVRVDAGLMKGGRIMKPDAAVNERSIVSLMSLLRM